MNDTQMKTVLITGSGGLVGSAAVKFYAERGWNVIGIDNNMRQKFFGLDGNIMPTLVAQSAVYDNYEWLNCDINDSIDALTHKIHKNIARRNVGPLVHIIHAAAQPSHDKAAEIPFVDFDVNARGTLNILELVRREFPAASMAVLSTNKVYGDNPNRLVMHHDDKRFHITETIDGFTPAFGFNESFAVDQCLHSLFGVSKLAADMYAQEYGKYFGLNIGVFRGGCLTGPNHASAELHGFLSYIVKCALTDRSYTIFGFDGYQVRDQIHSYDVVNALFHYLNAPRPGRVYNIGGGLENSASIREIIELIELKTGKKLVYSYSEQNRMGDHKVYYTDMRRFKLDYPAWMMTYTLNDILDDIIKAHEHG